MEFDGELIVDDYSFLTVVWWHLFNICKRVAEGESPGFLRLLKLRFWHLKAKYSIDGHLW
jgi:hypothetical protein